LPVRQAGRQVAGGLKDQTAQIETTAQVAGELKRAQEQLAQIKETILKAQAEYTGLPGGIVKNIESKTDEVRDIQARLIKSEGRTTRQGESGGVLEQISNFNDPRASARIKPELERANTDLGKSRQKVKMDEETILKAQVEHTSLSREFLNKMESNIKEVQDMRQRVLKLEGRTPRI